MSQSAASPPETVSVNLYRLAKIIAVIHRVAGEEALAAALQGRSTEAIIDKAAFEALNNLVKARPRLHEFRQNCDPWTEPDCPDWGWRA